MVKNEAAVDFEKSRRALLDQVISASNGEVKSKQVEFIDDLPNFLIALNEFEQESSKADFIIG